MSRAGQIGAYAILAVVVVGVFEVGFYAAGLVLQSKSGMWRVPREPVGARVPLTFDEYMQRRHPDLGWPHLNEYGTSLDSNGAQPNPYFPERLERKACVSLYGDSFTEGGDVTSSEHKWGNVLSRRLDCYVANLAMGGYGTDQAYLRFEKKVDDPAALVIFGIHPPDVMRNLTRIRDLENYAKWYALKPRYIFNEDTGLTLVPIPDLTEEQYLRILTEKGEPLMLEHENLQPGGPAGVVKLQFPYTFPVLRNMYTFYGFKSRVFGYPEYKLFIEKDHPLKGLQITAGLASRFIGLAEQRGKNHLVVMLPHPGDFHYFIKTGSWPYQNLSDELQTLNVPVIDFGPYLISEAETTGRALDTYFGATQHYNDAGNALVAEFVDNSIQDRKLLAVD